MENPALLKIAYGANILILIPACWGLFFGSGVGSVFQGLVTDSAGLRLLVGSVWAAILAASIAGFWQPGFFAPVVLIQIAYKALWLALFVLPLMVAGKYDHIPWGISTIFAMIVLIYPVIFFVCALGRVLIK